MSCVCQEEEETSFHFLGKYLLQCFQDIPSSERIFCNSKIYINPGPALLRLTRTSEGFLHLWLHRRRALGQS